jgi:streptogramin lyase
VRFILACIVLAVTGLAGAVIGTVPAQAGLELGGEAIIIDDVQVGSVFYTANCGVSRPSLAVTVVATFLTPTVPPHAFSPYAVGNWTGGYGGDDNHFGNTAPVQAFHFFLTPSYLGTPPGTYSLQVIVQDTGPDPAIATRDVPVTIKGLPPFRAPAKVKCPMAQHFATLTDFLNEIIAENTPDLKTEIIKKLCSYCLKLQKDVQNWYTMAQLLDGELLDAALHDPPDADYEQVPSASPPPLPPVPSGQGKAQTAATTNLEAGLAAAIGDERAMTTAADRAWGAGNADSEYWFHEQMQAEARFAAKTSADLRRLPALYDAVRSAFANEVPPDTVTQADVQSAITGLAGGLPPQIASTATRLGASPAEQQEIAADLLGVDMSQAATGDEGAALFATPLDFAAAADDLSSLSRWAAGTLSDARPAISGLSVASGPTSGGTTLTVYGSNLDAVTGFSFGPATTDAGLAVTGTCTPDECQVAAPPGSGTVNVMADSPGGPSPANAADRFSYRSLPAPSVSHIFPGTGPVAGGTSVSVFGTHLAGGAVFFGPTLAQNSTCTDTQCTATSPASAGASTVPVSVYTAAGWSAQDTAAEFSYTTGPPPTVKPPTVSGVSPASGDDFGGDTVTITGKGFTGATAVDFGGTFGQAQSFTVVDDSHITAVTPESSSGGAEKVDVTVYNSAGASAVTSEDHFSYVHRKPVITGISPRSGPTTGGTTVTVSGRYFNAGSVELRDSGVTGTCTPTRCSFTTPAAAAGTADVAVEAFDGPTAKTPADRFRYVRAPAPAIASLSPASGSSAGNTPLTVLGTNLAGGTVYVGGQPAGLPDTNVSPCTLTACSVYTPPGEIGAARVVVKRPDGTSSHPASFTYERPGKPSVTSVQPATGWLTGWDEVEIFGQNLSGGAVRFGRVAADSDAVTCTQTACDVTRTPAGVRTGTVNVTVTTPGGTSAVTSASRFRYQLPTVTKVSPASGWTIGGTPLTITGANLGSVDEIGIGGSDYTGFTCTATTCKGPLPSASSAGRVDITAVVSGISRGQGPDVVSAKTDADRFTYQNIPAPVVTSVTPSSGSQQGGDAVVVTGKYLDDGKVSFGSQGAFPVTCTDTRCTMLAPYHGTAGPVDVTVTTPAGTSPASSADHFRYYAPGLPTVTQVSPATGPATGGSTVVITGTYLTGGTVFFGSQPAGTSSCTAATSCTAVAPATAAGVVDVQVGTTAGKSALSAADHYDYVNPPVPAVSSISPATGPASGGTNVTVTGSNLAGGTVAFGMTAGLGSSCTATSCTAVAPPGTAGASTDVTVTTPGGTSKTVAADRFRFSAISLATAVIPGLSGDDEAEGGHVYAAPDGSTWFTVPAYSEIGKVSPGGVITVYPAMDGTPGNSSEPDGITGTPDGTIWYTEYTDDKVVARSPSGKQTGYQLPGQPKDVAGITAGPDGRLWFTLYSSGQVGAITTSGKVTLYRLPDLIDYPDNIVTGPDGRLWVTMTGGDAVDAITTSGVVTHYSLPGAGVEPQDITVGPDGRLWVADDGAPELDAITTSGLVTRYPLPATEGDPMGIASGADGRLWFTESGFDQVSALAPASGAVTDYPLPGAFAGAGPRYLTMADDGSLWVSELTGDAMVHVTGVTAGVKPAVTAVSPAFGSAKGGTTVTITGANLTGATAVQFGPKAATSVRMIDAAHVSAVAPGGTGTVAITVTTPGGTTAVTAAGRFRYGAAIPPPPAVTAVSPAAGPASGGTRVRIRGTALSGGKVTLAGKPASAVKCSAAVCTATVPAGKAGTVDVRVTTAGGTSPVSASDQFAYQPKAPPRPAITKVKPDSGPAAGGNTITITGTHLSGGVVTIGLNLAPATCTATKCTVTVPPGGTGTIDIQVTTAGGTSPSTKADRYRYR